MRKNKAARRKMAYIQALHRRAFELKAAKVAARDLDEDTRCREYHDKQWPNCDSVVSWRSEANANLSSLIVVKYQCKRWHTVFFPRLGFDNVLKEMGHE